MNEQSSGTVKRGGRLPGPGWLWAVGGVTLAALLFIFPTLGSYTWESHEQLYVPLRILHLARLWREQGVGSAPWLPQGCFGYGWPFFTFYAPWGYYVGAAARLGLGLDCGAAARLSFYLALWTGGLGMLAWLGPWARAGRWPGGAAGWPLAAALAFMLAPYHLSDMFARGSLAESWGFAVLPWVLAGVDLARRRGLAGALGLAAAYGVFMLTHNITALWGTLFVALYGLATFRAWREVAWMAAGGAGGAALSAFFWVPALGLLGLVRASDVAGFLGEPGWLHGHALMWSQFFVEQYGAELSAVGQSERLGLNPGWTILAGVVLACAALAAGRVARGDERRRVAVLVGLTLLAALAASVAMPWGATPPVLRYLQYPWRLLLFVICFGAGALAAGGAAWAGRRGVLPVFLVAPVFLAMLGVPRMLQVMEPGFDDEAMLRWNRGMALAKGDHLGAIMNDYLPLAADPKWTDPQHFTAQPPPPSRLEAADGGRLAVTGFEQKGTHYRWRVEAAAGKSDAPVRGRIHVFAFPGWVAQVDGQLVDLETGEDGLLELNIPSGSHEVSLAYRGAPLARKAGWISAAAALAWLALLMSLLARAALSRRAPPDNDGEAEPQPPVS